MEVRRTGTRQGRHRHLESERPGGGERSHAAQPADPWDETFNVGLDTGTPIDDQDYQVPFRFTGRTGKLTVKLGPSEI